MKNKIGKSILISMILTLFFSVNSYARDNEAYQEEKNKIVESVLLPEAARSSESSNEDIMRSQALAGATSGITNEGSGVIGVYAQTRMHIPVDWAYLTVYLERWYEDSNSWQIEEIFEKEFWPEDDEDGKLTAVTFSKNVSGQPSGYYYRVRALHELEYGDNYEVKVTRTDGILITSAP